MLSLPRVHAYTYDGDKDTRHVCFPAVRLYLGDCSFCMGREPIAAAGAPDTSTVIEFPKQSSALRSSMWIVERSSLLPHLLAGQITSDPGLYTYDLLFLFCCHSSQVREPGCLPLRWWCLQHQVVFRPQHRKASQTSCLSPGHLSTGTCLGTVRAAQAQVARLR